MQLKVLIVYSIQKQAGKECERINNYAFVASFFSGSDIAGGAGAGGWVCLSATQFANDIGHGDFEWLGW